MAVEIRIPQTLCNKNVPSHPFLAVMGSYELKQEIKDWFQSLGGVYDLYDAIFFDGKDMIVEITLCITDETLATHFKLRWL